MRPSTIFVKEKFGNKKLLAAEIGVLRGDNALTLVKALKFEKLYLVDIWGIYRQTVRCGLRNKLKKEVRDISFEKFYPIVVKRFADNSDVEILKISSVEALGRFPDECFDFVYIDASHSYKDVKMDIASWWPKVKKGGILAGHDYLLKEYPGLVQAVSEFIEKNNLQLFQKELDWWVVK